MSAPTDDGARDARLADRVLGIAREHERERVSLGVHVADELRAGAR